MSKELFRQTSLDRISSPEQLNDYIKVSNPSIWAILGAIMVLLIAMIVWSITGSLPTTVTVKGIAKDGEVACYLSGEDSAKLKTGMTVKLNGSISGTVREVSNSPLSAEEASAQLGSDYARQALSLSEWNTKVMVAPSQPLSNDTICTVVITVDEIRPIDFLIG